MARRRLRIGRPRLEANFSSAWVTVRSVARVRIRGVAATAAVPTLGLLFAVAAAGTNAATLGSAVYLLSVAYALSWYLRASLEARYPNADGASVPLRHHVWRVALACTMPLIPAAALFMIAYTVIGPASGLFFLLLLASFALTVAMFALGGVTAARVTALGQFNPLETWELLRGRRLAAIATLFLAFLLAVNGCVLFLLPAAVLGGLGLPGWLALIPSGVIGHAAVLLGLAAVATAVHDEACAAQGVSMAYVTGGGRGTRTT